MGFKELLKLSMIFILILFLVGIFYAFFFEDPTPPSELPFQYFQQ